ncbi:MAG: iron-sulfur cluster repair protein YtfE [Deltaproteobacteria bacterium]|nr:MAG: iron-sulfur cluster repair protein YtfE [Deltaproteobacteria bacterium]
MTPHAPPKDIADWRKRPVGEVIDHIVTRYHTALRKQISEVARLAEAVHSVDLPRRPGLVSPLLEKLTVLSEELTQHMVKEERLAFQMVRAAAGFVGVPLAVMEHEHRLAHDLLGELRELTGGWTPPNGASPALCELYTLMLELEADLGEHSALEDDLFARARADAERKVASGF